MVLDEATSALDTESETLLLATLRQLRSEMTVVVAAHRPRTVCLADKIVLLDTGRVVAEGTHEELLVRSQDYAKLFAPEPLVPMQR